MHKLIYLMGIKIDKNICF